MFPGIAKLAGNIQNYFAASVAKRGIIVLENKGSLKPIIINRLSKKAGETHKF